MQPRRSRLGRVPLVAWIVLILTALASANGAPGHARALLQDAPGAGAVPVQVPEENMDSMRDIGTAGAANVKSQQLGADEIAQMRTRHRRRAAAEAAQWRLTPQQAAAAGDPNLAGKIRICANPATPYVRPPWGAPACVAACQAQR